MQHPLYTSLTAALNLPSEINIAILTLFQVVLAYLSPFLFRFLIYMYLSI